MDTKRKHSNIFLVKSRGNLVDLPDNLLSRLNINMTLVRTSRLKDSSTLPSLCQKTNDDLQNANPRNLQRKSLARHGHSSQRERAREREDTFDNYYRLNSIVRIDLAHENRLFNHQMTSRDRNANKIKIATKRDNMCSRHATVATSRVLPLHKPPQSHLQKVVLKSTQTKNQMNLKIEEVKKSPIVKKAKVAFDCCFYEQETPVLSVPVISSRKSCSISGHFSAQYSSNTAPNSPR